MARLGEDSSRLAREIAAIGLITAAALVLASLIYAGSSSDAHGGVLPHYISSGLRLFFGVGAYAVPLVLFIVGMCYSMDKPHMAAPRALAGAGVLFIVILTATSMQVSIEDQFDPEYVRLYGGYLGAGFAYAFAGSLGAVGTWIVLAGMGLASLMLLTHTSTAQMIRGLARAIGGAVRRLYLGLIGLFDFVGEQVESRPTRKAAKRKAPVRKTPPRRPDRGPTIDLGEDNEGLGNPGPAVQSPDKPTRRANPGVPQPALLDDDALYVRPPLDLLTEQEDNIEVEAAAEEVTENIIKLEDTLSSFGVTAKVTHYEQGPVITRYEVEPDRGIRVGKIANLADDLAMALAAVDVRVEAPIPGKSAVGIEVPNQQRAVVGLRGLMESAEMQSHSSLVAVALGRDIAGHPVIADLEAMPHLLVAGATNSGKSVCLHCIICSILMRARPDEVKFALIDPKRVEMRLYDGIPHLIAPVVHSPKEAADVMRKLIREMDKRYDVFAMKSVVNIAEYNELAAQPKEHVDQEFNPLPRIVVIIDELADLMMQSRAEFEFSICRLAQLARATGIHLIVATQRPSVNVITGTIKANIPSRIALAVTSQIDSRTILDGPGAERLIGRGDMLYSGAEATHAIRVQGAFVPRPDLQRVVNHLTTQGEPDFQIIPQVASDDEEDFAGDLQVSDKLYAAAVQYVVGETDASVSMLQRRFKIGYARAGRLIDAMEQRGVVGPHVGSKPRTVLMTAAAYEELTNGGDPEAEEDARLAEADAINENISEEGEYVECDEPDDEEDEGAADGG